MRLPLLLSVVAAGAFALGLAGCNSASSPSTPVAPVNIQTEAHDHSGHDHGDAGHQDTDAASPMDKMKVELAKLSPEDAASAEKQHICPVSGEMLGTMGAPLKVEAKERTVWICCEGCRDQLLESPDEFLAKLKE